MHSSDFGLVQKAYNHEPIISPSEIDESFNNYSGSWSLKNATKQKFF